MREYTGKLRKFGKDKVQSSAAYAEASQAVRNPPLATLEASVHGKASGGSLE